MTRVDQRGRPAVRLPRLFYDDHWGRGLPTPEAVHQDTRAVWVWKDDPALPALLEDAQAHAEDSRAARRLLEAHRRQNHQGQSARLGSLDDSDQEDPDAAAMARLEYELNRG